MIFWKVSSIKIITEEKEVFALFEAFTDTSIDEDFKKKKVQ